MTGARAPHDAQVRTQKLPPDWWPIDPDDPPPMVERIVDAGEHTVAVVDHPADNTAKNRQVCIDCASYSYDGNRPLALSQFTCPPGGNDG